MFNQLATNASKSSEPPLTPGAVPDSEHPKQPPLPAAPYQPYAEQPSLIETPPYQPYANKPGLHEPPYEPYKGM